MDQMRKMYLSLLCVGICIGFSINAMDQRNSRQKFVLKPLNRNTVQPQKQTRARDVYKVSKENTPQYVQQHFDKVNNHFATVVDPYVLAEVTELTQEEIWQNQRAARKRWLENLERIGINNKRQKLINDARDKIANTPVADSEFTKFFNEKRSQNSMSTAITMLQRLYTTIANNDFETAAGIIKDNPHRFDSVPTIAALIEIGSSREGRTHTAEQLHSNLHFQKIGDTFPTESLDACAINFATHAKHIEYLEFMKSLDKF